MGRDVDIPPLAAKGGGGGVENTDENFNLGILETRGGLDFSKMSEL